MKTRTWILFLSLLFVLCLGLSAFLLIPREISQWATVSSGGKLVRTLSLLQDQEFTVKTDSGYNTVTVKDRKIAVTEASCPDHYCMHRGFCDSGMDIVCLPNGLVISFEGEQSVDGAVG